MKTRDFSMREERIIIGVIEDVFHALRLPPQLHDEAINTGWSAFLTVYRSERWRFKGDGVSGWERARFVIADELYALKRQYDDVYYKCCPLDQPVSDEIDLPRAELLLPHHGDCVNGVCFWDYLRRLPKDVYLLARQLIDGDSLEEIHAELHCSWSSLLSAFQRLRFHMEVYEAI